MSEFLDRVLADVRAERDRQDEKWGDESASFDDTGENTTPLFRNTEFVDDTMTARQLVGIFKSRVDAAMKQPGGAGMAAVLLEEVFEALAESDPVKLRAELIQVGAVSAAWCEYLDRRGANPRPVV